MRRRLFACAILVAAILALAWYSDRSMDAFTGGIQVFLTQAEAALDREDTTAAMQAVAQGIELCCDTRAQMTHFWRVEDLTELEASLQATLGYLERNAAEEALGELRRASVQVKNLDRLSERLL